MRQEQKHGTVGELHAIAMPTEGFEPELWIMKPTLPAVAMGSSQTADCFDQDNVASDGIELAPRRSGGGAVFIDPMSTVWIDLLAPRTSPWWSDDLVENFLMVGRVWQEALESLGVVTELCETAPARTPVAKLACWAGVGWGELTIGDAKVVGLSQRRTRWGARVQAMAVVDGSSKRVARYLPGAERSAVTAAIAAASVPTSANALESAVIGAFLHRI